MLLHVGYQKCNASQQKHGRKQNPHGIRFVEMQNEFDPVLGIIGYHLFLNVYLLKGQNDFANDVDAFLQLLFSYNQRWSETNDITMGRFGQ